MKLVILLLVLMSVTMTMGFGFDFGNCYTAATPEHEKAAKGIANYVFKVLGSITSQYYGDHATVREKLMEQFTKIVAEDAYMEVLFPPDVTLVSDPGPSGLIDLWFSVTFNASSYEYYFFSDLETLDALPRESTIFCGWNRPALVLVRGDNDGLVLSFPDGEPLCRKFRAQVEWLVEVRRINGIYKAKVKRITEIINVYFPYSECPTRENTIPYTLLEPSPPYVY